MIRLSLFVVLVAVAAPIGVTGCSSDSTPDSSITVDNDESFAITDIYVVAEGDDTFTDNLLGDTPLQPGSSVEIDVSCGTYDVELIDEAGGDCTVNSVDLCESAATWDITDSFCSFSSSRSGRSGETSPLVKVPLTRK